MPSTPYLPIKLVPDAEVPSFEALETQPLYGRSDLFTAHASKVSGKEIGDVTGAGDPPYGSTAHHLIRGVRVLRTQVAAEEGKTGPTDETRRIFAATMLQQGLIQMVHKAVYNARSSALGELGATYVVDNYINRRDQEMHDRYSLEIASDSRLFYALQSGGELPLPGPVEEMVLDFDSEMDRLARSIERNRLAMERLRFEWLSASVVVEAIRKTARESTKLTIRKN